jgi:two-component system sensor histidine kinase KdpD
LCCIGSSELSADQVRATSALAARWGCRWYAVSIQSRHLRGFSAERRIRVSHSLHLAASLGARTDLLYADDVAQTLIRYARDQAITTLVLGGRLATLFRLRPHLAITIAKHASDLEVQVLRPGQSEPVPLQLSDRPKVARAAIVAPLLAVAAVLPTTLLVNATLLRSSVAAMVMVLAVCLVAVVGGRRSAMVTTIINVLLYDFFVIPPLLSLSLKDSQSIVTFSVMLVVGLVIGELTHRLRFRATEAAASEQRAYLLSAFSRNLSTQMVEDDVLAVGVDTVSRTFDGAVAMLLLSEDGDLRAVKHSSEGLNIDFALAQRAIREGRGCGSGTSIEPRHEWLMLPLKTSSKDRGVLALRPASGRIGGGELHEVETFASLIALALERVRYLTLAQEAMLGVESERLRNSLLSALSHDLQTPLASVVGLADSVLLTKPQLSADQQQMIEGIIEEGQRMSASVGNLLEMARLESGTVRLRRQWHSVEEAIGSALAATKRRLGNRTRSVRVPADLPLVEFDAALIERVLINLLDNAAKYTPPGSHIDIEARASAQQMDIIVSDDGPGLPAGREDALFAKFARAKAESGSGVGLGLAICRAILVAHGGQIVAESGRSRGASFMMSLPLSQAPAVASETESFSDHV